jgi:hypothetical protein
MKHIGFKHQRENKQNSDAFFTVAVVCKSAVLFISADKCYA